MKIGGQCYCYLRNIQDLLSEGRTLYERRFGKPFKGPIIPFGSLVEYYPISAKDQSRIHQFGKKVLPGLFLGYALYAGGIWKDDVLVADIEELGMMDASEIYSRLNAKEVIFPKEGESIFPIADGRIKTPWRRSRPENIHLDTAATNSRRKSPRFFLENQKGLFHHLITRFRMPVKQFVISGPRVFCCVSNLQLPLWRQPRRYRQQVQCMATGGFF